MSAQRRYRHERARRALRGIGEQVAEAEKGRRRKAPVKRNRFIQLSGGTRTRIQAGPHTIIAAHGWPAARCFPGAAGLASAQGADCRAHLF
jgi:hypothetical protein